MNPFRVFFVYNFKFDDKGPEFGFKRCHFDSFYVKLEDAKYHVLNGFCSEAGWYQGMIIEAVEEGGQHFENRLRLWFVWNNDTKCMEEMSEPSYYNDIGGFIE